MNRLWLLTALLLVYGNGVACAAGATALNLDNGWTFRQVGTEQWRPASVPGCNHTDLLQNGVVKDPFWRLNELELQWIDKEDWEYRTTFEIDETIASKQNLELQFDGLDTYATVRLNGEEILEADNMFREWAVDVTDLVRVGSNELSIVFRSPITEGLQKYKELDYRLAVGRMDLAEIGEVPGGKRVSVFTRKAGYHFGWDWGPRLVSSGIWRPARLVAWDAARLTDLRIVQRTQSEQVAKLTAEFEIEADGSREASLAIRVDGAPLQEKSVSLKRGVHTYQVDFQIENPELWWCNGLGEPHLYDVAGVLECGSVSSEISHRVGVRTVELVREKDAMGTSFYFKVNGQPVFMKGANYIPCDIYPTRTTTDDYRRLLQSAVDSNFNMLRVWGGGIYENDEFYDLCDELGLLVWQDFMFACNMFPGNDAFLENVREEAIDNVRRLRNHPCLAMWCGNNEILVLQFSDPNGGTRKKHLQKYNDQLWGAYKALFHELLPAVVEAEDPDRFYWPSSPSAGPGIVSRDFGLEHGDEHYWGVWHRKKPYETYSTYIARFMSEYGFQSFPEIRTVEEFALPGDYGLDTEVMNHHQRSRVGNAAIEHYLLQSYNKPKDFEAFLYVGQVLQAELIKYAIEAHRRSRPFCMGTLYWQLNDVWPVASWSSIDHSFRWKALQYFVRKAYAPVLLSPFEKDGVLDVHVVNDSLAASTGVLRLRLMDFGGRTLWEERVDCELPANNAEVAFSISRDELLSGRDAAETLLLAEWESASGELADAVHYFRAVKQLRLEAPRLDYEVSDVGGGYEVALRSDRLAKNLYLRLDGADGFFSDNYFDLLPGRDRVVRLQTELDLESIQKAIRLRTLDSSY